MEFNEIDFNNLYKLEDQINYIENCIEINWNKVNNNPYLSEGFYNRYYNINRIYLNNNLQNSYVLKNIEKDEIYDMIENRKFNEEELKYLIENYSKYIDATNLSSCQVLSEEFIENNNEYMDWNLISKYQILSEKFIEKHMSKLNKYEILYNQILSDEFIEKHINDFKYERISYCKQISEKFIQKHKDNLNWKGISMKGDLSEKFIQKHLKNLNLNFVIKNQTLSEKFIEKNNGIIDYDLIIDSDTVSEEFIEKYIINSFDLKQNKTIEYYLSKISKKKNLSEEFIWKYKKDLNLSVLLINQKLSIRILEYIIEKKEGRIDWNSVSRHQILNEEFIEKYSDKLSWFFINRYQTLSEEFINNHSDKLKWIWTISMQTLSEEFINNHSDKFEIKNINKNTRLSEEFINKHKDEVNWNVISKFYNLSEKFINKYIDNINWYELSNNKNINVKILKKYKDKLIPYFILNAGGKFVDKKESKMSKYFTLYKIYEDKYFNEVETLDEDVKLFNKFLNECKINKINILDKKKDYYDINKILYDKKKRNIEKVKMAELKEEKRKEISKRKERNKLKNINNYGQNIDLIF